MPPSRERGADRAEHLAALGVDRAHAADGVVVLGHLGQALRRDAAAAGDVLQERQHVVGSLGAAEGQQQERVVSRHALHPTRDSARAAVSGRRVALTQGTGGQVNLLLPRSILGFCVGLHGGRRAMTSADGAGLAAGGARGFLAPYAEIFAIPRAWRFSVAGIIGRMPMSMYGLGTVLLISAGTGRYGLAGSVSAAGSLGGAVCAPQLGRLVDRLGQHRVLIPVCVTFALSVAGLVGRRRAARARLDAVRLRHRRRRDACRRPGRWRGPAGRPCSPGRRGCTPRSRSSRWPTSCAS